ncbi:MAG: DUF4381 domain-containing protein [Colwellia sp.]
MITNNSLLNSTPFERPWGNYLLEKIVETQSPEAISWLPQTVGWKIVFTFGLCYLLYKLQYAYKTYKANAYRRNALAWLKCYQSDEEWFYRQLPTLLRKTAISAFERSEVTSLFGSDWETWLDSKCQKTNFSSLCSNQLHLLAFSPDFTLSLEEKQHLTEQVTYWIKYHRGLND